MPLATIGRAVEDIRDGKIDNKSSTTRTARMRATWFCAAEKVTAEMISFMAVHGRGLICMPLTEERCDELQLSPQTSNNTSSMGTAFTISIEAREGVTTGISAADRAKTILTAVNPASGPLPTLRARTYLSA
jgi:3,4-dihydroxy 2-butanone 4-phosphate synthase/GTP cyclohydrolase II